MLINIVRSNFIEDKVIMRVTSVVKQPEVVRQIIKKVNTKNKDNIKPLLPELNAIDKQITRIEYIIEKNFQLFYDDIINSDALKARNRISEQELDKKKQRKTEIRLLLNNETEEISESYILHILKDFANVFKQSNIDKQKLFLKTLVKDITLTTDRDLKNINLHFELPRKTPIKDFTPHHLVEGGEESPSSISHLLMIRFTPHYPKRPIHLLQQY